VDQKIIVSQRETISERNRRPLSPFGDLFLVAYFRGEPHLSKVVPGCQSGCLAQLKHGEVDEQNVKCGEKTG
jgi:hypothetical protein